MQIDYEKLLDSMLKYNCTYADIFYENTTSTIIQKEAGRFEKFYSGTDEGIGFRAVRNGKTAYTFTNSIQQKNLEELAEGTAKFLSPHPRKRTKVNLIETKPQVLHKIEIPPSSVPVDEKIRIVEIAEKTAKEYDRRIAQVNVTYRDNERRTIVASSNNSFISQSLVYTTLLVYVVATDGKLLQTGYHAEGGVVGFELFTQFQSEEIALRAARGAVQMLTAPAAPAGKMPVVLASEAGGTMIHEAVGHGLEADHVQDGSSIFKDRLGTEVASKLITVVDDPTIPNKRGSYAFDDEGIPAEKKILIENGILKDLMFDVLTASKANRKSNGNGRRESYRHKPIPRMSNTLIAPGISDPASIVRSVEKGLFVKKMGGGEVNTLTGDFVFHVMEGYIIEKGTIGELVRGATIAGNGPEILKIVDMVGDDLGFGIGTCGKDGQGVPVADAQPTLRIPEIIVGGSI